MKLSERIRNLGFDAADWGFDDIADEVAQLEAENAALKQENRQLWDRLTVIEGFLRLKDLDLPGWSTDALLQESGF